MANLKVVKPITLRPNSTNFTSSDTQPSNLAGSGVGQFHASAFPTEVFIVPVKTFAFRNMTIYAGIPKSLTPGDLAALTLLNNGGTLASATATLGGTYVTNDTATITINGTAYTYTVVSGDTTNTLIATHFTSQLVAAGIPATSSGAVINVKAMVEGVSGNSVAFAVSKTSSAGTITASGATLTGGVSGTYF